MIIWRQLNHWPYHQPTTLPHPQSYHTPTDLPHCRTHKLTTHTPTHLPTTPNTLPHPQSYHTPNNPPTHHITTPINLPPTHLPTYHLNTPTILPHTHPPTTLPHPQSYHPPTHLPPYHQPTHLWSSLTTFFLIQVKSSSRKLRHTDGCHRLRSFCTGEWRECQGRENKREDEWQRTAIERTNSLRC